MVLALGALLFGTWGMVMGWSTATMAEIMRAQGEDATTMIDYTCYTCGIEGSAISGYSEIDNGTPCGYISGQAVRCQGTYIVEEREMTEEERAEVEQDQENWDRMLDCSGTIKSGGILALLAGLLMGVGAFGCLKDKRLRTI